MNRTFLSMVLLAAAAPMPMPSARKYPASVPDYSAMEDEAHRRRFNAYEGYRDDDDRARIQSARNKQAQKAARREADRQRTLARQIQ